MGDTLTVNKVYQIKRTGCRCAVPSADPHVGFDRLGQIVPRQGSHSAMCRRCQGLCERNN